MKIVPQLNVKYSEFKEVWNDFKHNYKNNHIVTYYKSRGPFVIEYDPRIDKLINFRIYKDHKYVRHLKLPHAFMTFIGSKRVFRELLEQIV